LSSTLNSHELKQFIVTIKWPEQYELTEDEPAHVTLPFECFKGAGSLGDLYAEFRTPSGSDFILLQIVPIQESDTGSTALLGRGLEPGTYAVELDGALQSQVAANLSELVFHVKSDVTVEYFLDVQIQLPTYIDPNKLIQCENNLW